MSKPKVRLISVTKQNWGPEIPKSLSRLANKLLPLKRTKCYYNFTGKNKPKLEPNNVLVFRFEGKLLGEAKFLQWTDDDTDCMIYRPIQQYRQWVVGSDFFVSGANAYLPLEKATIGKIRRSALRLDPGPYPKTGEAESLTSHRIGQGKVREAALERYGKRCCLCQIDEPRLLVAGHIRGWAQGKKERGNPANVILMCAFHDSLFGKGFITLAPKTYNLKVSKKKLSVGAYRQIKKFGTAFHLPTSDPPTKEFLLWHKTNVFEK